MVVISSGHPPSVRTGINSVVRRIDLGCSLLAPVLSALVISLASTQASAAVLALSTAASAGLQYCLFVSVYNGVPALAAPRQPRASDAERPPPVPMTVAPAEAEPTQALDWRARLVDKLSVASGWESWVVYARQDVALPGVALAFLYFTVLRQAKLAASHSALNPATAHSHRYDE